MRFAVALLCLVCAGTGHPTAVPQREPSATPPSSPDWPEFRGPSGQGLAPQGAVPLTWSATDGVVWKTEIPGEGWSSPIVWGDRVFVTTAGDAGRTCRILALDRRTGQMLWDRAVFTQELKRKETRNSYATPTPATDGRRVYAAFADGSFAAVTTDGEPVWTNRSLPFYGQHGLGVSLRLHRGLLITARDGSSEGEDKTVGWQKPWDQSFLVALHADTGAVAWRTGRGLSRIGHATPLVSGGDDATLLVSSAGDVVQGYDLRDGARVWSVPSPGEGVVPSPVEAAGLFVTTSGFGQPTIRAVRPGPSPAIAWEQSKGVPMQASPIFVAPYLYTVTDAGIMSALDAANGTLVWQERVGGAFSASPVFAGGRLHFLNEECETIVIETGGQYKEVARNRLTGRCQASMAVSRGQFFIRTDTALYAIGR